MHPYFGTLNAAFSTTFWKPIFTAINATKCSSHISAKCSSFGIAYIKSKYSTIHSTFLHSIGATNPTTSQCTYIETIWTTLIPTSSRTYFDANYTTIYTALCISIIPSFGYSICPTDSTTHIIPNGVPIFATIEFSFMPPNIGTFFPTFSISKFDSFITAFPATSCESNGYSDISTFH